jgi:hypothetical protein
LHIAVTLVPIKLARMALGIIFSMATRYDTSQPVANRALSGTYTANALRHLSPR